MSFIDLEVQELIEFKGNKKGIIVNIKREAPFDKIKQSIIDKIESSVGFFNGAKIYSINSEYLSDIQIMEIKHDITTMFDVEFVEDEKQQGGTTEFRTKYVNNLRSGESVDFDGDVVVMTDMKPGSQIASTYNTIVMGNISSGARIVAGGNVVVMGTVKGFIHAGAHGNNQAYVVAKNLNSKILQISNNIAEAPDEDEVDKVKEEVVPEIAFISDGRIVIESYLPKVIK